MKLSDDELRLLQAYREATELGRKIARWLLGLTNDRQERPRMQLLEFFPVDADNEDEGSDEPGDETDEDRPSESP